MATTKTGVSYNIDHFKERTKMVAIFCERGEDYRIHIDREREAWLDVGEENLLTVHRVEVPATQTSGGFAPAMDTVISEVVSKGIARSITAKAQESADELLGVGVLTIPAGITLAMIAPLIVAAIEEVAADLDIRRMEAKKLADGVTDQAAHDAAVAGLIVVQG